MNVSFTPNFTKFSENNFQIQYCKFAAKGTFKIKKMSIFAKLCSAIFHSFKLTGWKAEKNFSHKLQIKKYINSNTALKRFKNHHNPFTAVISSHVRFLVPALAAVFAGILKTSASCYREFFARKSFPLAHAFSFLNARRDYLTWREFRAKNSSGVFRSGVYILLLWENILFIHTEVSVNIILWRGWRTVCRCMRGRVDAGELVYKYLKGEIF